MFVRPSRLDRQTDRKTDSSEGLQNGLTKKMSCLSDSLGQVRESFKMEQSESLFSSKTDDEEEKVNMTERERERRADHLDPPSLP